MPPSASTLARFAADLDQLIARGRRLGLAVSGGPDSLALLVLAAAARPGAVEAATVDHALRPGSAAEAEMVADCCAALDVPHQTLRIAWGELPTSAVQERARANRYALLAEWMRERGLSAVATGHHRDDQAETLLMRLARGAGVRGLAGMRPASPLPGAPDLTLVRPLLGWARDELSELCASAAIEPAQDPSNTDLRFERVRIRQALADLTWLDPTALAASAAHCADADWALDWAADQAAAHRVVRDGAAILFDAMDVPVELRRRIVARIVGDYAREGPASLRGRDLDGLLASLDAGATATLRGVKCSGGERWRFEPAPARAVRS